MNRKGFVDTKYSDDKLKINSGQAFSNGGES